MSWLRRVLKTYRLQHMIVHQKVEPLLALSYIACMCRALCPLASLWCTFCYRISWQPVSEAAVKLCRKLRTARLISSGKPLRPVLCIYLLTLLLGNSEHCLRSVGRNLLQMSQHLLVFTVLHIRAE